MPDLVRDMLKIEGVQDVHDLHVWCITSNMYALSCHAMINDVLQSKSSIILQSMNKMLSEHYHIGHATIQFECNPHQEQYCSVDGLYCRMDACEDSCSHDHTHSDELEADPDTVSSRQKVS